MRSSSGDPYVQFQPLSADVAATAQLTPADMPRVARAGYRSVINNRPDGEGGSAQPPDATLREAARAAGLEYAYLPVSPAAIGPADARRFAELVERLPRPILAFCRSGARSRRLHDLALAA
jgi:uncharacterized protein (TIGR01244 family)